MTRRCKSGDVNRRPSIATLVSVVFSVCWTLSAECEDTVPSVSRKVLTVHPLFSEGMVLQQDRPVRVWGTAEPGANITVALAGQLGTNTTDSHGHWKVALESIHSGGPYELSVRSDHEIIIPDVMIGEVWLCSGQSNMHWPVSRSDQAKRALAAPANSNLRLFAVPQRIALHPASTLESNGWLTAGPDSIADFSAVCYFFGKHLQRQLGTPVGLIQSTWGGTKIKAWTPEAAVASSQLFDQEIAQLIDYRSDPSSADLAMAEQRRRWWEDNDPGSQRDSEWSAAELDQSAWPSILIPSYWEDTVLPNHDGSVWLRREFWLDRIDSAQSYTLSLGRIDDQDTTWINGHLLGGSHSYSVQRRYSLPAAYLRSGQNVIAVRVLDLRGKGGIYGEQHDVAILVSDGTAIPLHGKWSYKPGRRLEDMAEPPRTIIDKNTVSVLYNGMIEPLLPFQMRGVAWYQGEQNHDEAGSYERQLRLLIDAWRSAFEAPLFFNIVQLPNFDTKSLTPNRIAWTTIREAQRLVAESDPQSGLVVTIDIGEDDNIHPTNKLDVGKRLALVALHDIYRHAVTPSGPVLEEVDVHESYLQLSFRHAAGGLLLKNALEQTSISVCDIVGYCEFPTVNVNGKQLRLNLNEISEPSVILYAWSDAPLPVLFNGYGLPASPFRYQLRPESLNELRPLN